MADRLELEARFNDHASAGVKRLGKTLGEVKPTSGMAAANKWMGEFRGAAEKANVAVRPLTTTMTALGVGGLAASMSLGEIVKQMRELGDSTLAMKELSRMSGMTVDQIRRLEYAARKLHVDPAAVSGAIDQWSGKMVEFRRHVGPLYTEMMRQNQDVAKKIASEDPAQGFRDTLDFLSRIPAAAMKAGASAADAAQIQKRWAEEAGVGDMVPALSKGPEGIRDAMAEATQRVKPMTQAMVDAAEKMADSTNRMNQSWGNLKNDLGPSFLNPMSRMIDRLDEVLKGASAAPGDAAAVAGVGALSAAALFARRRIMAGSKIAGGAGLDRAAGELTGAAGALKQAAAALEGGRSAPGGSAPGGSSPGYSNLLPSAALAGFQIFDLARGAPDELRKLQANPDKDPASPEMEFAAKLGDTVRGWFKGSASDKFVHPDDDRLSTARPDDLKKDVREGSKAGIIAGLRELAQQHELEGGGDGGFAAVTASSGGLGGSGKHFNGGRPFAGASLGDHARGGIGRNAAGMVAGARESFDFWRSKGLTREQAAGLVGMEQGESQFNPRIVGDSGLAHGAFQHHPDRRARILTATGINIDTATHAQQLEAAYWEFQHTHKAAWDAIRQGRSATDAARSGVYLFEAPRDKKGQSTVRGGMAEGWLKRFNDEDAKAKGSAGAGTPAPSDAAAAAAEAFKKRQRELSGAVPQGHRAGGWIRGVGTGTSDSIPAMLSNGEFVVHAKAADQWGPLLHAINGGHLPGFADGGEVAAGLARHRSWRDFFRRPPSQGGMGAPDHVAVGAMAMMMGESGKWLNPSLYGEDVNGKSGGAAQWHDVERGPYKGKVHRLSDLMRMATEQHAPWTDTTLQQAWFRKEAVGSMSYAWNAMRRAKTAAGALNAGVRKYEVPARPDLEVLRRMPNISTLAREGAAGGGVTRHEMDPLDVTIKHNPHTGQPIVTARAGRGVNLKIRTGPTMQPT